jgi:hypothetical protein
MGERLNPLQIQCLDGIVWDWSNGLETRGASSTVNNFICKSSDAFRTMVQRGFKGWQ